MGFKMFFYNMKLMTAVLIIGFLSGCGEELPLADDTGATSAGISSAVNSNNQFAFELYSKLSEEEGNVFFSPWSISTALAMTYEGARGQTAEEMATVLHLPEDDNVRRSSFAALYNRINRKDAEYKLHTANALWADENYEFLSDYIEVVLQYYAGKTSNVDFQGATEEARKTINDWVEDQTKNKIKGLFPQGTIKPITRLVLTNAIYFKGDWVKKFDKKKTRERDFRVSPNRKIQVPMMSRSDEEAKFNYAETQELQILEMLYKGEDLSMLVLLPRDNNLESLEALLSAEKLAEWRNMLREERINVLLPKFTFTNKYSLPDTLKEMGMPLAFSMEANFSGMDGTDYLFIGQVIHQAFVDVNEEGTEAAAATGISMELKAAAAMQVFFADHPFIFIIQERETGSILFLGRVVNPLS